MSGKELSGSSLYDSGRADSGFLSGAIDNSLCSGEITPPSPKAQRSDKAQEPSALMRLDSGVDVGLSDQLSDLCIEDSFNDLGSETSPSATLKSRPPAQEEQTASRHEPEEETHWELYFHQDVDGETQLHVATRQGFLEVVFSLVSMIPGAQYLNIRNNWRQTALHLAVLSSQPRIVRRLVCAGACTKSADRKGNTPLHLASMAGDLACVRALTEPVSVAELTSAHLAYTPPLRQPSPPEINMYNYDGLTCVHLSLINGHLPILRHLVWFGGNIDAREYKCGHTVLHMAAETGNEALASLLLREMRANPLVSNYAGHTPFHVARRNKSFIRTLLTLGVPDEGDYSSTDDDDSDSENEYQAYETGFRDFRANGIVNATA